MNLTTAPDITLAEVSAALRAAGLDLRAAADGSTRITRRAEARASCSHPGCTVAAVIHLGYHEARAKDGTPGAPYCVRHALERM